MMTSTLQFQPKKRSRDALIDDDLTTDKQISPDDFFLRPHPFSDLKITLAHGAIVHADKSLLSAASPQFRSHFQANPLATNLDLIDIELTDFLLLLQFLYPQFDCTITRTNVNFLFDISQRFGLFVLNTMCRNFISYYLSKIIGVKTMTAASGDRKKNDLILFEDGTQVTVQNELPLLVAWFRAYIDENMNESLVIKSILHIVEQCSSESLQTVLNTDPIGYTFQTIFYQARARYLEKRLMHDHRVY